MDNLLHHFVICFMILLNYAVSTLFKTNVWSAVARWNKVGVLFPPEHTNIEHTSIIFLIKGHFKVFF